MPEWLPGTGFKRTARRYKQTLMEATNKPYDFVLRQMEAGTNEPSYVSKYVQQYEGRLGPKEDDIGRWTALGIYLGGADTVSDNGNTWHMGFTVRITNTISSSADCLHISQLLRSHDLLSKCP